MITIKTLTETPFEQIHSSFKKAFEDYVEPFDLTLDQLKYMVERRGCDLSLSFGAFNRNELVGFTLNGIGLWKNKKTAYDTGTGIIKEFRKQGIATRIFEESLPILKDNNVEQYLLEVIKTNKNAVDLYQKAGFNITRDFDYYVQRKNNLTQKAKSRYDSSVTINEIEFDELDWNILKSFWTFEPSWQNSVESLTRKSDYFTFLGIFRNNSLIGYGVIEKHTGDIPQFAIAENYRKIGLGRKLFNSLIKFTDSNRTKIINAECKNRNFKIFAEKLGFTAGHGQYEMILKL